MKACKSVIRQTARRPAHIAALGDCDSQSSPFRLDNFRNTYELKEVFLDTDINNFYYGENSEMLKINFTGVL